MLGNLSPDIVSVVVSQDECKADGPRSFKELSTDIAKKRMAGMQIEEQYDLCIDLTLRRFVYGSLAGLASALVMFRSPTTRWSAVAFGAGVGLGSAYADSAHILGDKMVFPKWPPR